MPELVANIEVPTHVGKYSYLSVENVCDSKTPHTEARVQSRLWIERSAYSVGQAQRELAKVCCQGLRITVLQSH